MADFMGDHVGLRELPGRAELARQHAEERRVQIELPVGRAVERPRGGHRVAARRRRLVAEQYERRRNVTGAHRLKYRAPDVLGVAEHGSGEVLGRARRGGRWAGRAWHLPGTVTGGARLWGRGLRERTAAFDHPDHFERIDAEHEARDHDDHERAAAELDATPARKATPARVLAGAILDVFAAAEVSPLHESPRSTCPPGRCRGPRADAHGKRRRPTA